MMRSESSSPALVFVSYRSTPHFPLRRSPLPSRSSALSISSNVSSSSTRGSGGHPDAPPSDGVVLYMPPPTYRKWRQWVSPTPFSSGHRSPTSTPAVQLAVDSTTAARERSWPMLHTNLLVPSPFPLITMRHVESPSVDQQVPTREGKRFE